MSDDGSGALSGAASGAAAGSVIGPWGTVIGGAVGAVGGLMGASKNSKAASSAQAQQEQAMQDDLNFRKMQYNYEQQITAPARQKYLAEAMDPGSVNYEGASGAIKQQYGNAAHTSPYNYGTGDSGLTSARNTTLAMGQASDLSGAYRSGLDKKTGMLQVAAGAGNPVGAGAGVGQAYSNLGGMYGQQNQMYNNAAQQGWAAAANGIGGIAKAYGANMRQPTNPNYPPTTPIYPVVEDTPRIPYGYDPASMAASPDSTGSQEGF